MLCTRTMRWPVRSCCSNKSAPLPAPSLFQLPLVDASNCIVPPKSVDQEVVAGGKANILPTMSLEEFMEMVSGEGSTGGSRG
jgi:hypothetical protein